VIADAGAGPQAIALCRALRPDLLILALRRSALASCTVARMLRAYQPSPHILALGDRGDPLTVRTVLDAGATGYLLVSTSKEELLGGVYRVCAGRPALPIPEDDVVSGAGPLCAREQVILREVARGLPTKAIAQREGISERTVSNHLQHAFRKLGASNRVEAIVRAREYGLLPGE
jgi:DNA-binding NarL/FixJ family response regulator